VVAVQEGRGLQGHLSTAGVAVSWRVLPSADPLAPGEDPRLTRSPTAGVVPDETLPRLLGARAVAETPLTETDLQERVGHLGAAADRANECLELSERPTGVLLLVKDVRDEELCAL